MVTSSELAQTIWIHVWENVPKADHKEDGYRTSLTGLVLGSMKRLDLCRTKSSGESASVMSPTLPWRTDMS